MTIFERHGIEKFPKIIIVGNKRIEDTDLINLIKHEVLDKKLYYLSVEKGIDVQAFRKANIKNCKAVYFFSKLTMDDQTESHTHELVHHSKQVENYLDIEYEKYAKQLKDRARLKQIKIFL